jgi:hypothetical protein
MAGRPRQPGQQRVVAITKILLSRLLVFVSFLSAPSPALQHRQQENRSIQLASSLRFKAVWLKNELKLDRICVRKLLRS